MKKGMIFTLDVAFGSFLVILLIIVSLALFYTPREGFGSSLQMSRTASDIITALDNDGTLATLDDQAIGAKLRKMAPEAYGMRLTVSGTFTDVITVESSGPEVPVDRFILSGKRFFVRADGDDTDYGTAKYEVWLR